MSYGDHLEATAAELARACAALRGSPPGPAARASAAVSRARLYRSLEQQTITLGDVHVGALPQLSNRQSTHRLPDQSADPVTSLAVSLRLAGANTAIIGWPETADLWASGPVAVALHGASQAIRLAGDVLASNTGPATGMAGPHRPSTTDGLAVLAGVGRRDNLAAIGRLAAAAAAIDARIALWMRPDDAPVGLRPLLTAAQRDAWETGVGLLRETALIVATRGVASRAPVLDLGVAPAVDNPLRWSHPRSGADCVDAIDAARSWLTRRPRSLTVGQLSTAANAALAITHCAAHVLADTAPAGSSFVKERPAAAARHWRAVARMAAELRSPTPAHTDRNTLVVALDAVASWLHTQLRSGGQWRSLETMSDGSAGDRTNWRATAEQIAARMPDLADLLRHAIERVQAAGGVLAPTGRLAQVPGLLVRAAEWKPVSRGHRSFHSLTAALGRAANEARAVAAEMGVPARPGLAAARAEREQPTARTSAARLAARWYPQPDGMAERASPPAATPVRSEVEKPGRSRTR